MLQPQSYPQYIKYMGSKSKLISFVIEAINTAYDGGGICDLFAGSCSLSGALRGQVDILSNDIQAYSGVISHAYLTAWKEPEIPQGHELVEQAQLLVANNAQRYGINFTYDKVRSIKQFNTIESQSRDFISKHYDSPYHLFTKYYSGTWWSAEQCLWIDALKEVADRYQNSSFYNLILSSVMYAMAYCSQGTGHYAQYRDAKSKSSLDDILTYRKREFSSYFLTKYNSSITTLPDSPPIYNHEITSLDYVERLNTLPKCTIYADPPYCFVHYSRFYHAIETLVLYDYPEIQLRGGKCVKGRYRVDRHQSPFCIKSKVRDAFKQLFDGVKHSNSNLVLSYSNTGMIELKDLRALMKKSMAQYSFSERVMDHDHMTMGRQGDRTRKVKELLLIAKRYD
ncbi:DNA adenine methylase [Desulfovibrio psychrotolerans]|uniref:Site-specific DNA-methyltransferase n=1 Tax=Desulfovibrio psychrotolerans TaxID=415242 RepID=A0A7J0BT56_9BACT|nr:DNA adenine methylase [Desulfovibrio psychrotolerans]GFM36900.1 site-specific DNA-methyltransferase [Desulfovibrio psychrotolerans]